MSLNWNGNSRAWPDLSPQQQTTLLDQLVDIFVGYAASVSIDQLGDRRRECYELVAQWYIDNRFDDALRLVEEAAEVARHGDSLLPTRYWVDSIRAQVEAGRGEAIECQRAFDAARGVLELGETTSLDWLRFSGARIDEEQASCLIQLGQPEPAERILTPLLERPLSTRRRASVLVDLAAAGALRGDPVQTVSYGSARVDIARRTRSGYLGRRLEQLRPRLAALEADRHVAYLEREIARLATSPTH